MEDIFNYSEDFKKIISEMFKEMKNGITDGLLCKTSGIEDERNLLLICKSEGYNITLNDCFEFIRGLKEMVKIKLDRELSDVELEMVAGGINIKRLSEHGINQTYIQYIFSSFIKGY